MIHNAPLLRRESLNRQGVRSGCKRALSAATIQQWMDGRLPDNVVVVPLSEGAETPARWVWEAIQSFKGSGPKWGSPTRPCAVRMGSDPTFTSGHLRQGDQLCDVVMHYKLD